MSKFKFNPPIEHLTKPKEYQMGLIELSAMIQPLGLERAYLWDYNYWFISLIDWGKVLKDVCFNMPKYTADKFDCENFAALLWGQFNTPTWAPFAIGYMWTDKHGMIMCIDANEDLWLVEPQTDTRRSDLDSWQGTNLRFVII